MDVCAQVLKERLHRALEGELGAFMGYLITNASAGFGVCSRPTGAGLSRPGRNEQKWTVWGSLKFEHSSEKLERRQTMILLTTLKTGGVR
jgi:hypothetical protein